MSDIKKRLFSQTAAALLVFDSSAAVRQRAWTDAETSDDVAAAEQADVQALRHVQAAYHSDTADINSSADCNRIDIDSMRRLARDSAPVAADLRHESPADVDGTENTDDQTDVPAPR